MAIIVPTMLWEGVLYEGGHFGFDKTLARLKVLLARSIQWYQRFVW